jgi:hypothetical protein
MKQLPISIFGSTYCGIGWVDTLLFFTCLKKIRHRSVIPVHPCRSMENGGKKIIGSIDLHRKGHDFLGHALPVYRGSKIVLHNVGLMGYWYQKKQNFT